MIRSGSGSRPYGHGRFSPRRKALLALVLLLLAVLGWMHFTGAAGISGMQTQQMDWNGDGTVTQAEIMQAFFSVVVKQETQGARVCRSYYWRGEDTAIRVDCRTEIAPPE